MPKQRIKRPFLELFAAGKVKSVLIAQSEDVEGVCSLLNSNDPLELCSELRTLVQAWQGSGPNLARMLKDDPILAADINHGRTLLVPTKTGKGHLLWLANPRRHDVSSWKFHALAHFMNLIVNPHWHKLGGPCERCRKYYVKKTSRQKTYCSRRCGSAQTALARTRKRRRETRTHKLREAQKACKRWATTRTRYPWKQWVSAQTKMTVKWLTRVVNKGDLREPVKAI